MLGVRKSIVWLALIFSVTTVLAHTAEEFRKWTDATGKFEIDAKLLSAKAGTVRLEKRDGKVVEVPLDKLSAVDQGYIEGRLSAEAMIEDDNPFKEFDASQPMPPTPAAENPATGVKEYSVDFQQCAEISIDTGQWNPNLGEQELEFDFPPIPLPGKADFFEKLVETAFSLPANRAVLTYHIAPPGQPRRSRMVLVDLKQKKTLANAIGDGSWVAMAIHDDGDQVVVRNDAEESQGQLGTVRLIGKKIEAVDLWSPYEALTEPAKEKVVRFAQFLDERRLLTLSQSGQVVVWDFATRKPLRRFAYHGAAQPALSNDRQFLGFAGGDLVGFVNLQQETATPWVKSAPGMNYWINTCFSPSCRRFAAANHSKLMIWDVSSGDVLFDGSIPGLSTNGKLLFPSEEFVMVGGDKLFEFGTGIKLWQYQAYCDQICGRSVLVANEDKGGKMAIAKLPHARAIEVLQQAKLQSDLFVLKKGATVGIDLSEVPAQYSGDVEQSLKRLLELKGFQYASNAPIVLKPTIQGPTREAISYSFFGSFAVNKYISSLNIVYQGKSLWNSGSGSNIPGIVSANSSEEVQKQLDEAGRGPSLKYFNQIVLPDYLQKPTNAATQGQPQQTIGISKFTAAGLSD